MYSIRIRSSSSSKITAPNFKPLFFSETLTLWIRAEVLGALVNAVFLLALCVIIILEAIQKIIQPESVEQPKVVAIVGGIGLLMNLLGLVIFGADGSMHGHSHDNGGGHGHSHSDKEEAHGHSHTHKKNDGEQLNMKGVFLHVLGDAVGSVVVVISG